jgi:hypothetical protein
MRRTRMQQSDVYLGRSECAGPGKLLLQMHISRDVVPLADRYDIEDSRRATLSPTTPILIALQWIIEGPSRSATRRQICLPPQSFDTLTSEDIVVAMRPTLNLKTATRLAPRCARQE